MVKKIICAALAIVALFLFFKSVYFLNPCQAALVIRFGRIVNTQSEPGFKMHSPIESETKIYTGERIHDIPISDVITADKKSMIADNYVIWKVTDPIKYFQTLSGTEGRATERIEAAVFNATKNTISSMTQDEIVAARGNMLTDKITQMSNMDISQYGITVTLAEIKALDLPDDNKQAVFNRMISERNNIAASYSAKGEAEAKKIRNETDKQVAILKADATKEAEMIKAEGEEQYMKILSEAYNNPEKAEFYTFIRSLDSLEALSKDGNTIILDKDSEFTKIIYGTNTESYAPNQPYVQTEIANTENEGAD